MYLVLQIQMKKLSTIILLSLERLKIILFKENNQQEVQKVSDLLYIDNFQVHRQLLIKMDFIISMVGP